MKILRYFLFLTIIATRMTLAATATWITSGGGDWTTNTNWNPAQHPSNPGDIAIFPNDPLSQVINLSFSTIYLGELQLANSNNTEINIPNIQQAHLVFENNGNPAKIQAASGSNLITGSLEFKSDTDIILSSLLTISGDISGGAGLDLAGTSTLVLSGSNSFSGSTSISGGTLQAASGSLGSGSIVLSGGEFQPTSSYSVSNAWSIVPGTNGKINTNSFNLTIDGDISGTWNLEKNGLGTLIFDTMAKTYSGDTLINQGTLEVKSISSIGSGISNVTVGAGASLLLTGGGTQEIGNLNGSGTINLGSSTLSVEGGFFSGSISGSGALLIESASGVLNLTGTNNTFSGGISINEGQLSAGHDDSLGTGTLTFLTQPSSVFVPTASFTISNPWELTDFGLMATNGFDLTLSGQISGASALQKTSSGTLTLTNATNDFTGGIDLIGGTLLAGSDGALSTGTITFSGGAFQPTASFTASNNWSMSSNGIFDTNIFDLTLSGQISGASPLSKIGGGTLTLTNGANDFTGGISLTTGTLLAGSDGALSTGTITFFGGTFQPTASFTASNNWSMSSNGIFDTNGSDLILNGDVSGSSSLTKENTGTLIFDNVAKTYTGDTIINGGTLSVTNTSSIGNGSDVTVNGGGNLELTGGGTQAIGDLNGSGAVNLGTSTLSINGGTFSGDFSGTGTLTKTSSGTLTLSGSNALNGININGGTLQAGATNNLGNAPITFNGGNFTATNSFYFDPLNTCTFSNTGKIDTASFNLLIPSNIDGSGTLIKEGSGKLTLKADNSLFSGEIHLNDGILDISDNSSFGTGDLTFGGGDLLIDQSVSTIANTFVMSNPGSIDITFPINVSMTGDIEGGFLLTKTGVGRLNLSGNNTSTGGFDMNGGILEVSNPSSIGSGPMTFSGGFFLASTPIISINDWTMTSNGNFQTDSDVTLNGALSGGGTLVKTGTAMLTLDQTPKAYSGPTEINDGTLIVTSASSLGDNSAVTINGGALEFTGATTQKVASLNGVGSVSLGDSTLEIPLGDYSGDISGSGGLLKTGSDTFILNTIPKTYTGPTVIDEGTLEVTSSSSIGNGSAVTINGGTLALTGAATQVISSLNGVGTVSLDDSTLEIPMGTYSGDISGNGGSTIVKTGGGILTLSGNNSYEGATNLEGGELSVGNNSNLGTPTAALNLHGGTLSLTGPLSAPSRPIDVSSGNVLNMGSNNVSFGGPITGGGSLDKTGLGTLTLGGVSPGFTGPTMVSEGGLVLSGGSIPSSEVTIAPGASLRGNGTTGTLHNDGLVFPGASIGVLNVAGDYNQTGLLEIEIAPDGTSDLVNVTGNANLGGTLLVEPVSDIGLYMEGTQYAILTADEIFGDFDFISEDTPFDFDVFFQDEPDIAFLAILNSSTLILPVSQLQNSNAKSVGNYLLGFNLPVGSDLVNVLEPLTHLGMSDLSDALDQMSPARFSALSQMNFKNERSVADALATQMSTFYRCSNGCQCDGEKPWSVWFEPFMYFADQRQAEHQRAFDGNAYGGLVGGDYTFASHISVGGSTGYSYADVDWEKNLGHAHINSVYMALYSSYCHELGFAHLSLIGTRNFYHESRRIKFTGFDRTATNNHKGWDVTAHFKGGLEFPTQDNFHFQPTLDIDYINVFENSYAESGADSIDLKVDSKTWSLLRSQLAMNVIKDFKWGDFCFSPGVHAGWIYDANLSSGTMTARFTDPNSSETFSVQGFKKSQARGSFGANITGIFKDCINFNVIYRYEVSRHYGEHNLTGRGEWKF